MDWLRWYHGFNEAAALHRGKPQSAGTYYVLN